MSLLPNQNPAIGVRKLLQTLLILPLLLVLITPGRASAQNDLMLTQYWAVPAYYNPAATGTTDYLRIRGGTRLQWLGIHNAPKSFLGAADSPFQFGKQRIGAGVNIMQESLGLFSNLLANVQLSYKFKALKGTFSIGLQGGYYKSSFKGSEVEIPDGDDFHQGTDTAIPTQDLTGNAFDLSAGISYTHKYFSIGISGMHLLSPKVKLMQEGSETTSENAEFETELPGVFYFMADGNIPLKNTLFELQPSVLVGTDFGQVNAGITMRARYNKFLSFGLGYRWDDAVSVMIGAEFRNFFLGYSYDYPTSAIARGSIGSHELVAGYQLKLDFSGKNKNKHRSIRIM